MARLLTTLTVCLFALTLTVGCGSSAPEVVEQTGQSDQELADAAAAYEAEMNADTDATADSVDK